VALLSLAACLALPVWVYTRGASGFEASIATMKNLIIWPTLVYFISGTVWAVRRDRQKGGEDAAA
jgi:hypothetical protein